MPKQNDYNDIFTSDITALKATIETLNDVMNVMDWAIESALEELEEGGHLSKEESLLAEYKEAIKVLRKGGFRRAHASPQEAIACPGCKAMLKDVTGKRGERCSWCGYEFK